MVAFFGGCGAGIGVDFGFSITSTLVGFDRFRGVDRFGLRGFFGNVFNVDLRVLRLRVLRGLSRRPSFFI
jgi:hypothetical protein